MTTAAKAGTVSAYLASLSPERAKEMKAVRKLVRNALPAGFVETFQHGMISWVVPLARKPDTYNGQPLPVVAVAAQKSHLAIYLMALYAIPERRAAFEAAYRASGKRLDMGKSCLRIRTVADLATDALSAAVASVTVDELCAAHDAAHGAKAESPTRSTTRRSRVR